ncbi:MAG: hypothetical protein FJ404_15085 [Verrucomicrobia bacterium]|nr:hypothetical protein [Verrucomicrobiota bacterium]
MKTPPRRGTGWREALRWSLGITLILVAHLAFFAAVYQPGGTPEREHSDGCVARVLTDPASIAATLALHEDPARLAVPDHRGSSGRAWLKPRQLVHDLREEPLTSQFMGLSRAPLTRPDPLAPEVSIGPSTIGQSTPLQTPPPVSSGNLRRSVDPKVEWRGTLRGRGLSHMPELTNALVTNLIAPSRIHLAVERSGRVQTARIVGHSAALSPDQARADQAALNAARKVRFEPVSDAEPNLQFGELLVRWALPAPNPPP